MDPAKLIAASADLRRWAEALLPPAPTHQLEPAVVRKAIAARRDRDRHFDSELFADPAWDMLLDLFAARLEQRLVSVSSLCTAAAVPATTALRWIGLLEAKGHIARSADPVDGRRILMAISDDAADRMHAYFAGVRRRGEAMA